jgi:hypothetical protein
LQTKRLTLTEVRCSEPLHGHAETGLSKRKKFMSIRLREIRVAVYCDDETCGDCHWLKDAAKESTCELFGVEDLAQSKAVGGAPFRCEECLTAEATLEH